MPGVGLGAVLISFVGFQAGASRSILLNRAGQKRQFRANDEIDESARDVVWVHAYARSSSSTVLSMVSKADSAHERSRVFSLFEPCHSGDIVTPELKQKGCQGMLDTVAHCDFSGIQKLHGWFDVHSIVRGKKGKYSPEQASKFCKSSELVAFKTVSLPGEVFNFSEQAFPLLSRNPRMNMVKVIRDPRSIYASWHSTWPFRDTYPRNTATLTAICDSLQDTLSIMKEGKHPQVHAIKFEEMIKEPEQAMRGLYESLKRPFGQEQQEWLRKTFRAEDCPEVQEWNEAYSDCHTSTRIPEPDKWRKVLTQEEKDAFAKHKQCQEISESMGYPLI
mmetsp:Transcript_17821/g.39068  ORF Transcript_17821/g.39068 Transcript_17821/m.39068 type:complete len:333 (+) Transcript_17821:85-1083(+)